MTDTTEVEASRAKREAVSLILKALGAVVLLWIAFFIAISLISGEALLTGQFGDAFGTFNTLFSGLAFAGLIVTVLLQTKELAHQREELTRTTKAMVDQSESVKQQLFDGTFYQQLRLYNENVNAVSASGYDGADSTGRKVVATDMREFRHLIEAQYHKMSLKNGERPGRKETVGIVKTEFDDTVWPKYNHIIMAFKSIMKLISSADVSQSKSYAKVLWAQCSVAERELLRFNVIVKPGSEATMRMYSELGMVHRREWYLLEEIEDVLKMEWETLLGLRQGAVDESE